MFLGQLYTNQEKAVNLHFQYFRTNQKDLGGS